MTTMLRRIRIRSVEDIGLLIVLAVIVIGLRYFLPKYFMQDVSERTLDFICYGAAIVLGILWVFIT